MSEPAIVPDESRGEVDDPGVPLDEQASAQARSTERAAPAAGRVEEVLVTGTHIRGAEPTSPVLTITQQQMRLAGHNNLGEVVRALPQNFAGGQNPGVAFDATAGGAANQNITGSSAINLRGLGHDATLTLLNGIRFPYDGLTQATDVSVIPVAAIERMEILLDGASAIYGSDAVGGVANIVLKRDYEGAELAARYGMATDGGYEAQQYTAVAGHVWDTGGLLVTGDHSRNGDINARSRSYLSYLQNQNADIYPSSMQNGALFTGHQALSDRFELSLDAFFTKREQEEFTQSTVATVREPDSRIWGLTPSLRIDLPADWTVRLFSSSGRNDSTLLQRDFSITTGAINSQTRISYRNRARSAGADAEGSLFMLPAGEMRLSIGAGYRNNGFERVDRLAGTTTTAGTSRTHYRYGEVHVPVVSRAQGVPLVSALALDGAVRYENSNAFGRSTTPKLGLIWTLSPGFDVKASWGRSFKAPTLSEQYENPALYLYPPGVFGAPAGSTALLAFGGNPRLGPERAAVMAAGFSVSPQLLRGARLELNWFDIDYTDRVVIPITVATQALTNPAYAEFVTLNPSVEQQAALFADMGQAFGAFTGNFAGRAYDPANVSVIIRDNRVNAASQHVSGVDLAAGCTLIAFGADLSLRANANWITESTRKLSSLAAPLPTVGVNYFPPSFKGRIDGTWSRGGFTVSTAINYIGGVKNTSITPQVAGDAMTTMDLTVDYEGRSAFLGDFGVNIALTNLFDADPPYLRPSQPYNLSYDSTNYSALGRTISATVTKRF
jgi:outer membrane cobalamin receptor